jgi:uncharacterized membrane protein
MTWLSGMVLLFLLYYFGGGLIDTDVADISLAKGIAIGLCVLVFGLVIYDLAVQSPLATSAAGFAVFSLIMIAAILQGPISFYSVEAAHIHVGAVFGTIDP